MIRRARAAPRRTRGLALIVVLWMAVLITLLASSFAFSLRTEAKLALGVVERAHAAAAAHAGVRRLVAAMAGVGTRELEPVSMRMEFDGIPVALRAVPENARIDLNAAPEALIKGLLTHAASRIGAEIDVDAVSDAILDWRDTDTDTRPDGAEARDYETAGLEVRPRDGPLLSVSELGQVMGVTPPLYRVLSTMVTIHSWSPQINPMSASRDVLLSVPGLSPAKVDAFLLARLEDPEARESVALLNEPGSGVERYLSRGRSVVFSVTGEARTASGVRAIRRAVVKFNANAKRPLSVLAWYHDAHPEEQPGADDGG